MPYHSSSNGLAESGNYHVKTFDYSRLRIPFSKCYVYNHVRIKGEDVRKGRKGSFVDMSRTATHTKSGSSLRQTMNLQPM